MSTPHPLLQDCIECDKCTKSCSFLQRYGNPRAIDQQLAAHFDPLIPYSCSLCSRCQTVCPVNIRIKDYFLEQRRQAVQRQQGPLKAHQGLLRYETMVNSRLFTAYAIPPEARRVIFPGCGAIGKNPATIKKLHAFLEQELGEPIGIVLDCCLKISHDLGRQHFFNTRFSGKIKKLQDNGVEEVITLCPSCTDVFNAYSPLRTTPVYRYLAAAPSSRKSLPERRYAVHDPCVLRYNKQVQEDVRTLIKQGQAEVMSMPHERQNALCCGEGGGVCHVDPSLPAAMKAKRLQETDQPLVVYCYACRDFLANDRVDVEHILDLLFETTMATPAWKTWVNRFSLKCTFISHGRKNK
ncbi:MAG: (Fe-S)-binding protein [Deltaproteobacteria bacterium]|nr:(Fe-S)-binding protein [Candidatus Anaeroferrophillus wilburensis]MBN2888596.1 (Fe-S)-binding protein [Deltaproteobacteria bacterium]